MYQRSISLIICAPRWQLHQLQYKNVLIMGRLYHTLEGPNWIRVPLAEFQAFGVFLMPDMLAKILNVYYDEENPRAHKMPRAGISILALLYAKRSIRKHTELSPVATSVEEKA